MPACSTLEVAFFHMSLLEIAQWVQETSFSVSIRESILRFPCSKAGICWASASRREPLLSPISA